MPVRRGRRPGTWRVYFWAAAEQRQREWIVEGSAANAKEYEAKKRLEYQQRSLALSRGVPTFVDFCSNEYEPTAKARLRRSTWKRRAYSLVYLCEAFGALRLNEFSAEALQRFVVQRVDKGNGANYVNCLLSALRTVLAFARERGQPVPPFKIKLLPTNKPRVRCWSLDEVRCLYKAAQAASPWLVPMLQFLFDTGCRKGEAIAAEWTWVDWSARMLRIPATEHWKPKSGRAREVPLSDALLATLRGLPRTGRTIFLTKFGTAYLTFPDLAFTKRLEEAGVDGSVHVARHTYASHFLAAQPDLMLLADVMGHSKTRVTELYTHLLPEHLERARNVVQLAPPGAVPLRLAPGGGAAASK